MNTDLLKKLIKLANHNPNENEANLAARRVCKMIADDSYNLVGGDNTRRRAVNTPNPKRGNHADWFEQVMRDYQRSSPFTNSWSDPTAKEAGEYYTNYKPRTGAKHPTCKCGNDVWAYNIVRNNYTCGKCGFEATAEEFRASYR